MAGAAEVVQRIEISFTPWRGCLGLGSHRAAAPSCVGGASRGGARMTQQRNRKAVRVLLTVGAPIVVAVLGVPLGVAGGSARADNGNAIILGSSCSGTGANCATNDTTIEDTGIGVGLQAEAVNGVAGLLGINDSTASGEFAGVLGEGFGAGDDGVFGNGTANGVHGATGSSSGSGVFGENRGNGNGVAGHASNSAASGVYGQNDGAGFGVAGRASSGIGVLGDSANGIGVWASSQNAAALKVTGKAQFSRSGVATVAGTSAAPKKSVRVSLPITAKSMMTALLQKFVAGVYVVAAVPNVTGGYLTIYLNKAVSTSVGPIAWIVTERP